MRTRTKNTVHKSLPALASITMPWTAYTCAGVATPGSSPNTRRDYNPSEYTEEVMTDVLGKGKANPVYHGVKHVEYNTSTSPTTWWNYPPTGTCVYGSGFEYSVLKYKQARMLSDIVWTNQGLSTEYVPANWVITIPHQDETKIINDLHERAERQVADHILNVVETSKMYAPIKSSLSNFRKVQLNWGGIRQLYAEVTSRARKLKSLRSRDVKRWVAREASSSHLALKFGFLPLINDISATIDSLSSFDAEVKRIALGKRSRYSHRYTGTAVYNPQSSVHATHNSVPVESSWSQGLCLEIPTIRYVLVTEPNGGVWGSLPPQISALLGRFASSPAQFMWELKSFSFFIDWFVDLRGLLRRIDELIGYQPYKVVSFTRSERWSVQTDRFMVLKSPCNGSTLYDDRCGSVTFRHYDRTPVGRGLLLTPARRFRKSQAALTASLILQNLSRYL